MYKTHYLYAILCIKPTLTCSELCDHKPSVYVSNMYHNNRHNYTPYTPYTDYTHIYSYNAYIFDTYTPSNLLETLPLHVSSATPLIPIKPTISIPKYLLNPLSPALNSAMTCLLCMCMPCSSNECIGVVRVVS
jgi:hypothetical protein